MNAAQIKSRERVRDLAEVFTHDREVIAMLDLVPDMLPNDGDPGNTDRLFLEPACGHGNFLVEILRRKLAYVSPSRYGRGERFEHRVLRCVASIYGIDISEENVREARERIVEIVTSHCPDLTESATGALEAILQTNVICADAIADAAEIELIEYRPESNGRFRRIWSRPLDPHPNAPSLFSPEPRMDLAPIHYSELKPHRSLESVGRKAA